jgi:hypothetical protein
MGNHAGERPVVGAAGITLVLLLLGSGAPDTPPLSLSCSVVEATGEDRKEPFYDEGATRIKEALRDLGYNTFRTVYEQAYLLAPQEENKTSLTKHYTMGILFEGMDDTGRARVKLTVMLLYEEPTKPPCIVVETTLLIAPGGKARVGGLRGENKGDLVFILARL